MSDNIDLYRLELTNDPFQAKFITTPEVDLPPECVLPEPLPDIPPLPELDLSLPPLDCNFQIDVPLIPAPYFCTPAVSGSISITSPSAGPDEAGITVTGSAGIAQVSGSECDYELTGSFSLELSNNICTSTSATGTVSFSQTTPEGPISIGEISISSTGCGVELTGGPITISASGSTVEVDDSVPPLANACESSTDWLHLTSETDVDGVTTISLAGGFPKPCFNCDAGYSGVGMYVTDPELHSIKTSEISFKNACCDNDYSYWNNCGQHFQVGPTSGGSTQFQVDFVGDPKIELAVGGNPYYQVTKTLIQPAIDEGQGPVRPRLFNACSGGVFKRVLVMASGFYD